MTEGTSEEMAEEIVVCSEKKNYGRIRLTKLL